MCGRRLAAEIFALTLLFAAVAHGDPDEPHPPFFYGPGPTRYCEEISAPLHRAHDAQAPDARVMVQDVDPAIQVVQLEIVRWPRGGVERDGDRRLRFFNVRRPCDTIRAILHGDLDRPFVRKTNQQEQIQRVADEAARRALHNEINAVEQRFRDAFANELLLVPALRAMVDDAVARALAAQSSETVLRTQIDAMLQGMLGSPAFREAVRKVLDELGIRPPTPSEFSGYLGLDALGSFGVLQDLFALGAQLQFGFRYWLRPIDGVATQFGAQFEGTFMQAPDGFQFADGSALFGGLGGGGATVCAHYGVFFGCAGLLLGTYWVTDVPPRGSSNPSAGGNVLLGASRWRLGLELPYGARPVVLKLALELFVPFDEYTITTYGHSLERWPVLPTFTLGFAVH